jgi:hypothetical protein
VVSKGAGWLSGRVVLLDGELPDAAILAFGLVDTAIGAAADEANDLVALVDSLLVVVPTEHGLRRVHWV